MRIIIIGMVQVDDFNAAFQIFVRRHWLTAVVILPVSKLAPVVDFFHWGNQ
jgi:hypothetical protein